MSSLTEWESFYVIVGSSAGALIGLQFVVITLLADLPLGPGTQHAGEAFLSPTIVHFAMVLFVAAVLSAPWHQVASAALLCGIVGVVAAGYSVIVGRRVRVQPVYQPVFEDWLFHFAVPFVAYIMLSVAAFSARSHVRESLFVIAGAALLLLFCGIHNAWDAVTYNVFVQRRKQQQAEKR
jgi:hypothetical protein